MTKIIEPLIERAAAEAGISMPELAQSEREAIIASVRARFGLNLRATNAWDIDHGSRGVYDPEGAARIAAYVGERPCLLVPHEAQCIWRLADGAALLRVLEEGPLFELYVCDEALTYLLCHNDHDYLIGWGDAQAYVQSRLPGDS